MTDSLYYVPVYLGSHQLYLYCLLINKNIKRKKTFKKKERHLNVYTDILFSKLKQCMLSTTTKSYILQYKSLGKWNYICSKLTLLESVLQGKFHVSQSFSNSNWEK